MTTPRAREEHVKWELWERAVAATVHHVVIACARERNTGHRHTRRARPTTLVDRSDATSS